jgi:hypothetical protein
MGILRKSLIIPEYSLKAMAPVAAYNTLKVAGDSLSRAWQGISETVTYPFKMFNSDNVALVRDIADNRGVREVLRDHGETAMKAYNEIHTQADAAYLNLIENVFDKTWESIGVATGVACLLWGAGGTLKLLRKRGRGNCIEESVRARFDDGRNNNSEGREE